MITEGRVSQPKHSIHGHAEDSAVCRHGGPDPTILPGFRRGGLIFGLETPAKVDVWPDSTEVLGGLALFWAAHRLLAVWPSCGLRPAEHC